MASKTAPLLRVVVEEEPTPHLTPAWLVLFVLSGVAFTGNALISLIGPFLPQHFGEIGVSQIWSGVIFSGFPVAMLICSPIAMSAMGRFGRVNVLICGLVLQGISSFAFGFADTATGGVGANPQAALAIYVSSRLVCGFGGALANNAIFSISVDRFPDALGRVMSLNEVLIGVGFSVGPPIGTVLYLQGGFGFPFYAAGCAVLMFAPFALMLRGQAPAGGGAGGGGGEAVGLFAVLTPSLLSPAVSLFFATSVFGVVNSNLALYLQNEVGVSEAGIGNMFSALAVSYAVNGMLIGGPVLDRVGAPRICAAGGCFAGVALAVGLGLEAGSFPRGSHARMVYLVAVLAILGLAQAMTLVPSLPAMHSSLPSAPGPGATEAVVAWFNIFLQLGLAVSPVVGTAMTGALGFERTMTICGGVIAAYGALALCYTAGRPAKTSEGPATPPMASIGFGTPQSSPQGRRRSSPAGGAASAHQV